MSRRHIPVILIVLAGAVGVAVPILINLATNDPELQKWLKTQPWYSLKVLGITLVGLVAGAIYIALQQQRIASGSRKTTFSASELKRRRGQIIGRVRHEVNGLLNQSLYRVARIDLGLEDRPGAVENPITMLVQEAGKEPRPIRPGTRIGTVFDEHAQGLLILGPPGSGKTTLLLELTHDLLERSERDDGFPIPVISHLSSWAVRRASLADWMADELNRFYGVPPGLAEHWFNSEQLLPLLDGLDEVAAEHREACVEAINEFRSSHGLLPMAVCSRVTDYEALTQRLHLPGAVLIQLLTKVEIRQYLWRAGDSLVGLQSAFQTDPLLWELLNTPLMLSIAMLAFQDSGQRQVPETGTLQERRSNLIARYVDAMFRRRADERRYTRGQTMHWLTWLACSMVRLDQSVFHLEGISKEWLLTRTQTACARSVFTLIVGLVFFLVGVGPVLGQEGGVAYGLVLGLFGGWYFGLANYRIVDTLIWSWREARFGLVFGLAFGVLFGLGFGLMMGLMGLLAGEIPVRATPNEGTRRSGRNGIIVGLAVLVSGLVGGLVPGLLRLGLFYGLIIGPVLVPSFGLMTGLQKGGGFFLRHWVRRLILRLYGCAPLRYVRFLESPPTASSSARPAAATSSSTASSWSTSRRCQTRHGPASHRQTTPPRPRRTDPPNLPRLPATVMIFYKILVSIWPPHASNSIGRSRRQSRACWRNAFVIKIRPSSVLRLGHLRSICLKRAP
jgi:DNA polymerase III delta prime subunit